MSDPEQSTLVPGAKLGRAALMIRIAQMFGILVALLGLQKLHSFYGAPPSLIGFTHDHRALTGPTEVLAMSDERFNALARSVVQSALSRTEKGLTPELLDFVTDACAPKLYGQLERNKPRAPTFVQKFEIEAQDGIRVIDPNPQSTVRAYVRGFSTTTSSDGLTKRTFFYWAVVFVKGPSSSKNPLGWKLNDIFEVTDRDFYEKDLENAASEAVKLPINQKGTK